jgi:hypothetical protein
MVYNGLTVLAFCFLGLLAALPSTMVAGADLDPATFQQTVLNDGRVWMVEFYSAMCGGCQEFASTWERIEKAFSEGSTGGAIATGKINIDNKAGLKIAEELGVLDDGVPHVRLFKEKGDVKGTPVVKSKATSLVTLHWVLHAHNARTNDFATLQQVIPRWNISRSPTALLRQHLVRHCALSNNAFTHGNFLLPTRFVCFAMI